MSSVLKYKNLIEIKSMSSLQHTFESESLNELWVELKDKNPSLAKKAILTLLSFI